MKKIIILTVMIALMLCAFASCDSGNTAGNGAGNGDGGTTDTAGDSKYDGTVYSADVALSLVKSEEALGYVNTLYMSVRSHLSELGVNPALLLDSAVQSTSEIALGETNRAASVAAKALVDSAYTEGNITFAVVYKDGVLALYAADESSFNAGIEYLYENYLVSDSLKVDTNLSYSFNMTSPEYEEYIVEKEQQQILDNWDNRFDYLSEYISSDAISELKNLYNLYDEKVYLWVANLWDEETGAFYYACSSRDYEGFYPDVESTTQALKIVCGSGMTSKWGGGLSSLDGAIPEEMQEQILNFVFSLYNDDDGYFYHKQWGTDINDDRKGRDLTWSMQLVKHFNASLPEGWVDAVTRLKNQNSAVSSVYDRSTVGAVASVMSKSSVSAVASDNRFASRENFIAYLNQLNILSNSYGKGHQLASQADQIKAAGLIDVCCDYLDDLQTQIYEEQLSMNMTPNGLWEHETNYHAISGFFKLAVVYSSAGRAQQYLDRVLDSCIKCILSNEEAIQVVYVYNPWAAIGECISGMNKANTAAIKAGKSAIYDVEKCREEMIYPRAAEMFSKTYEKALPFRKADGAYSYNLNNSSPTIQGVYASMGLAEGDMNATALLVYHMTGYMKSALGFELPDIWNINDFERFMSEIENLEYAPKKPGKTEIFVDFDDMYAGDTITDGSMVPDSSTTIVVDYDPVYGDNMALKFESPEKTSTGFKAFTSMTTVKNCFIFEADFNMMSKSSGTTHQISFYAGGDRYYVITFGGGTNSVTVGDISNVTGSGVKKNDFGVSIPTEEWFTLKLEMYIESTTDLKVKIYINDEYIMTSTNYFGSEKEGAEITQGVVNYVWFYNLISPAAELYIDNVSMRYEDIEYSTDDTLLTDSETYDFEKTSLKVGANMKSDGSYAKIESVEEDATGGEGNVYHVSKTGTNTWDQLSFKLPTDKQLDSYLTFSMDFKFNQFDGSAQLAIGSLDPNAYYLMLIKSSGSTFKLSDSSTMQSGYTPTYTSFDSSITVGEWHNLRIELYVSEDSNDFEATIYVDDDRIGTSENFYNYSSISGADTNTTLDFANIRFTSGATVDMYIDNVVIAYE